MNCADKDHENQANPSRTSIMLEILNALARYANEMNRNDARFESVTGSKFTQSKNNVFGCKSK